MRNRWLGLLYLFIFLLIGVMSFSYADPPLPMPVGRVVWVKGTLKAVMPNKEERTLQKASVIYLNDTLSTDANSQAQIVFTDNTLMTFRPDTKFYIDKYEFHSKNKNGSVGKYIMQLIEGGFRTITGLIAKSNPPDYQVNTPVATIGVRGTDYAVYIHAGQLAMIYYAGSPCVENKQGSLCLSKVVPYSMTTMNNAPVALQQQPAVFKEKQEIIPTKMAPFTGGFGGPSGGAGSGNPQGGTVSSFCIQ